MNIFFLALNPKIAAVMHCDKHVVKMILETAQLLCTTHHLLRRSHLEAVSSLQQDSSTGGVNPNKATSTSQMMPSAASLEGQKSALGESPLVTPQAEIPDEELLASPQVNLVDEIPYKATHVNHPSSIWLRQQKSHYLWLSRLGMELVAEYELRYGNNGTKTHKCKPIIEWLARNVPPYTPEQDTEFWAPPPCMPDECKVKDETQHYGYDSIQSYRNYYVMEKRDFAKWKVRDAPEWFTELCEEKNLVWPVPIEEIRKKRELAKKERERKKAKREARAAKKAEAAKAKKSTSSKKKVSKRKHHHVVEEQESSISQRLRKRRRMENV